MQRCVRTRSFRTRHVVAVQPLVRSSSGALAAGPGSSVKRTMRREQKAEARCGPQLQGCICSTVQHASPLSHITRWLPTVSRHTLQGLPVAQLPASPCIQASRSSSACLKASVSTGVNVTGHARPAGAAWCTPVSIHGCAAAAAVGAQQQMQRPVQLGLGAHQRGSPGRSWLISRFDCTLFWSSTRV